MYTMGKTVRNFRPIWLIDRYGNRVLNKDEAIQDNNDFWGSDYSDRHNRDLKKIKKIDRKNFNVKIADGLIFGENISDEYGDPVGGPKRKKYYKRLSHRENRLKGKEDINERLNDE